MQKSDTNMKAKKIIVEIIFMILILNFFYEGIYKIAYWNNYSVWLHHAPLLQKFWVILSFAIPLTEIGLSIALIIRPYKIRGLYLAITLLMLYVLWIMAVYLLTDRLFWPYHAMWTKPTWMQKMIISIGLSWLGWAALVLSKEKADLNLNSTNDLRKLPANAQL